MASSCFFFFFKGFTLLHIPFVHTPSVNQHVFPSNYNTGQVQQNSKLQCSDKSRMCDRIRVMVIMERCRDMLFSPDVRKYICLVQSLFLVSNLGLYHNYNVWQKNNHSELLTMTSSPTLNLYLQTIKGCIFFFLSPILNDICLSVSKSHNLSFW